MPAFCRGGYYSPAVLEPRFGWGGYVPPAAPDNVFCRGAQCAPARSRIPAFRRGGYYPPAAPDNVFCRGAHCAPAIPRLSASPPTRKRWGHTPPGGTSQEAEGCAEAGGRKGRPYGGLKGRGGEPDGPVWDRPLRGVRTPRAVRIGASHDIGFSFFMGRTCTVPHAGFPLFVGADIIRQRYWNHMLGGGGYVPPAAPDNVFCRGAHCAPAVPRLSTTPPTCNVGATPRPGAHPKGARVVPDGRPRGPPLRRAEGKGRGTRRAGLGPAPTGGQNAAGRADRLLPRYRVFVFRGADMHRSPHRIPAFRRGGYYPPAVLEPHVGWGRISSARRTG